MRRRRTDPGVTNVDVMAWMRRYGDNNAALGRSVQSSSTVANIPTSVKPTRA
jgi:hypothetical protein